MQDRTPEIARRLRVTPAVLALVVGAPWTAAVRRGWPGTAGEPPAPPGPGGGRGRSYVGVPTPEELSALGIPPEQLRHFGLSVDDLRAGGYTDADLRAVGLLPAGSGAVEWFVAGEPYQLMLGLDADGPPLLARPQPGWDGPAEPTLDPVDVRRVPGLSGCPDPDGDTARAVRAVRDELLAAVRARIGHCAACFALQHGLAGDGLCDGCAARWRGVVF